MKLKCGKGILDKVNVSNTKCYNIWSSMLHRCYNKYNKNNQNSYKDCIVCEEWLIYSNFEKWFNENYIDGYSLDKDLLLPGNRVYSPKTCCFIPSEINTSLIWHSQRKTDLPIGVTYDKTGHYQVIVKQYGKSKRIGSRYYSIESAFAAYKTAKEKYVKELSEEFYRKGKININVYNALQNYQVPQISFTEKIIKKYESQQSKKVYQIKDGIIVKEYCSINEAGRQIGITKAYNYISECCRGLKKTYKGYEWKFVKK